MTQPHHLPTSANFSAIGFIRLPTILQLIPIGRSTLWEMIARGDFPTPVKLSARVSAWRSQDVLAFMASRSPALLVEDDQALVRATNAADIARS